MLTAILAVRNLFGEQHDLWTVNAERSYHENFTKEEWEARTRPGSLEHPVVVDRIPYCPPVPGSSVVEPATEPGIAVLN